MPTSVMPKGVEHVLTVSSHPGITVMPTSVMPKGVEHRKRANADVRATVMPTSVMPKGVEHQAAWAIPLVGTLGCPPL